MNSLFLHLMKLCRSKACSRQSVTAAVFAAASLLLVASSVAFGGEAGALSKLDDSQVRSRAKVMEWLSAGDAASRLSEMFPGGGPVAREHSASDVTRLTALLAQDGAVRMEVRASHELAGAVGAFSAEGTTGRPTIYVNGDWLRQGATEEQIEAVLIEELGHFIDDALNGADDSPGDEGELFAAAVTGRLLSEADLYRIMHEDDTAVVILDGKEVQIEMAQLLFSTQSHFLAGDGKAALEQNSITVGPAVPGERFLFVSDPPGDPLFNGNNVAGTLYAVDADNQIIGVYYGEISRLLKSGSNVIACQFYVYGPDQVLPPSNSSPPQQTIMINISANLFEGLSIKTSSDPVDKALNKLLPPNVAPVAELDTDSAFMPSCSLSQEQGTATGNVIAGVGSDGNGAYLSHTAFCSLVGIFAENTPRGC